MASPFHWYASRCNKTSKKPSYFSFILEFWLKVMRMYCTFTLSLSLYLYRRLYLQPLKVSLANRSRQPDMEASEIHTSSRRDRQQDGKDIFHESERVEGGPQCDVNLQIIIKKIIIPAPSMHTFWMLDSGVPSLQHIAALSKVGWSLYSQQTERNMKLNETATVGIKVYFMKDLQDSEINRARPVCWLCFGLICRCACFTTEGYLSIKVFVCWFWSQWSQTNL